MCDSDFAESKLKQCEEWLTGTVLPWIAVVLDVDPAAIADVDDHPVLEPAFDTTTTWEPIDDGTGGIAAKVKGKGTLRAELDKMRCPGIGSGDDDAMEALSPAVIAFNDWKTRVQFHLYEV